MVKTIDIEYCGGQGYGAPSLRLKKSLQEAFGNIIINCHAASTTTGKIEVAWIDNGQKEIVWSKNKIDTESNHPNIVSNLKTCQ